MMERKVSQALCLTFPRVGLQVDLAGYRDQQSSMNVGFIADWQ